MFEFSPHICSISIYDEHITKKDVLVNCDNFDLFTRCVNPTFRTQMVRFFSQIVIKNTCKDPSIRFFFLRGGGGMFAVETTWHPKTTISNTETDSFTNSEYLGSRTRKN